MSKLSASKSPACCRFYGAGLAFVLLCAVLPVYRLWALAVALAGTAVVFVAAKRVCPPRILEKQVPFHTGDGDVDQMLAAIPEGPGPPASAERCAAGPRSFRRRWTAWKKQAARLWKPLKQTGKGKTGPAVCKLLSAGCRQCAGTVRKNGPAGRPWRKCGGHPLGGGA